MFKPALFFSLILCLLLSGFALAQEEDPYQAVLDRIQEAAENESTSLYFYDLEISTLPAEIGQLSNLQSLDIYGSQITSLPPEIGQLTNLRVLAISDSELNSVPAEIGQLSNLRELYLDGNNLTSLPSEIGQLTNLRTFEVSDNQLSSLPTTIGNLLFLESLGASSNQLSAIPTEIGLLSNLNDLELAENRISALPVEIGKLSNLAYLNLSVNRLTSLPSSIGELENLRSLYISANALAELPAEIGNLTNVQSLDVSDNNLTSLPPEIGQMNNLSNMNLQGNPLSTLPPEINNLSNVYRIYLDETQSDLLSYPSRRLEAGSHDITVDLQLTEAAIYFVFDGEAGKSVLLQMESADFDTYLILLDNNGNELASNDNSAGWSSPAEIGAFVLPYTGEYTVVATSSAFINYSDTLPGRFIFRLLRIEDTVIEATEAPAEATAEVTPELAGCDLSFYIAPECPDSQIQTAASVQNFEHGRMVWLQIDGSISVFFNNGTYLSGLLGGDGSALPEVTEVPDGFLQPQLGFGYVWLNTAGVRDGLGWATSGENYYTATYEQLGEASASSQYVYLSMPDGSSIWLHPYTHTWGNQ